MYVSPGSTLWVVVPSARVDDVWRGAIIVTGAGLATAGCEPDSIWPLATDSVAISSLGEVPCAEEWLLGFDGAGVS